MTLTRQQLAELLHQMDRSCRTEGINPRSVRMKCHPRTWHDIRHVTATAELDRPGDQPEDRILPPWAVSQSMLRGIPVDADPDMAPGVVELVWRHQFLIRAVEARS